MSWRTVVISHRCKLDFKMGNMVVRSDKICRIRLDEVSVIIIEDTAISITAYLLNEISKRKIKLIFCDESRNPASELVPLYGSHDCSARLKAQLQWRNDIKVEVWTSIVAEKISKQSEMLFKISKNEEANMLQQYISELELNDSTNREGHSAKVYFNALFGKDFSRTQDIGINSALNYGYSILLSIVNREIVANGYTTKLGLFHSNMFNFFNFSCDLMEPFRVVVDRVVYEMKVGIFEKEEKHLLITNLLNYTLNIDGREEYFPNAIKVYCKAVLKVLNSNDISNIRFYEFLD